MSALSIHVPGMLADAMERLACNRGTVTALALQSLRVAGSLTHAGMHQHRARIIERALRDRGAGR